MNLKKLFFAAVIVLSANASFGQNIVQISPVSASHLVNINIPNVALLALKSSTGTAITLAGTAPTVAGDPMTFEPATANNSTIYMNYSSIVKNGFARNVTVKITDGTVPAGLKLTVRASLPVNGGGNLGSVLDSDIIIPSGVESALPIVSGITSAYTGKANGDGHNLTYKLGYADTTPNYAALRNVNLVGVPLTIIYTLSDISL